MSIRIRAKRLSDSNYIVRILMDGDVVGFGMGASKCNAVACAVADFRWLRECERASGASRTGWL